MSSTARFVATPLVCAILGHFLAGTGAPAWLGEIAGVSGAFITLQICRSRVAPALAAADLPVVFGVHSWLYPAVVLAATLAIVAVAFTRPQRSAASLGEETGSWPLSTVVRGWIVICAWILTAGPVLALPAPALAPPLFVSAFDWLSTDPDLRASGPRRWALVTGAALTGSLACTLMSNPLAAGTAGIAATLGLMRLLRCSHAPALAIALIPLITGSPAPTTFTISIALGLSSLYGGAAALTLAQRHLRLPPNAVRRASMRERWVTVALEEQQQ